MIIGVPKEVKEQEQRVALLPSAVEQLTKRGHTVLVEKNAGFGSGYPDQDYEKAGAEIIELAKDVWASADMIVKVKEPLPAELPFFFQAEDGIRYLNVTGVQTCALPI